MLKICLMFFIYTHLHASDGKAALTLQSLENFKPFLTQIAVCLHTGHQNELTSLILTKEESDNDDESVASMSLTCDESDWGRYRISTLNEQQKYHRLPQLVHRVFLQSTCTFKVCRLPVSSEDLLVINGQLISASAQQTIGSVQQKDACVSHQDLINVSTDRCILQQWSNPHQTSWDFFGMHYKIPTRMKYVKAFVYLVTARMKLMVFIQEWSKPQQILIWTACIRGAKRKAPYFEVHELDLGDFLNSKTITENL
ncbi:hypothetical protein RRG08_029543 [Elysia crispata]|uniref:Uncharacterized protein n=1 Tax=Elysia crispata TaxID=231223 RepID=A0AAE1CNL8_9GAST|nr:hypothetical protein RRG08_029543 [Elysia crispata]